MVSLRMLRWGWVFCLIMAGAWAGAQSPDLGQDTRLQKPITVQEPLIPLKQLFQQLSAQLGLTLSAAPDIAEDKVCVLVKERPAHEVLRRLAETLRYEWQRSDTTDGYRLYQPNQERVREALLRQALLLARRQLMEPALRALINLARRYSPEELRRMNTEAERSDPDQQARLVSLLQNVNLYAAARVMGDFRATEWNRFWQGETLIFSTAPQAGELPLAPSLQQLLSEWYPFTKARSLTHETEAGEGVISLRMRWDAWRGTLFLHIEYRRRSASDRSGASYGATAIPYSLSAADLIGGDNAREKSMTALETNPNNRVWREWANVSERPTPSRRATASPEPFPLPSPIQNSPLAQLIELARRYGLDLYADAYRITQAELSLISRLRLRDETLAPLRWQLPELFWLHQEGDALMARHKDYFWLRPSEIPEDWLRPLEARKQKQESISLDEWAQFASALNELQIERIAGLPLTAGWSVRTASALKLPLLVQAVPALRFWASLTPQQKQAALAGKQLYLSQLTPPQRQRFEQALNAPAHHDWSLPLEDMPAFITTTTLMSLPDPTSAGEPYFALQHSQMQFARALPVEIDSSGAPRVLPPAPNQDMQKTAVVNLRFYTPNRSRDFSLMLDML